MTNCSRKRSVASFYFPSFVHNSFFFANLYWAIEGSRHFAEEHRKHTGRFLAKLPTKKFGQLLLLNCSEFDFKENYLPSDQISAAFP